jgi:hypothetical protein
VATRRQPERVMRCDRALRACSFAMFAGRHGKKTRRCSSAVMNWRRLNGGWHANRRVLPNRLNCCALFSQKAVAPKRRRMDRERQQLAEIAAAQAAREAALKKAENAQAC